MIAKSSYDFLFCDCTSDTIAYRVDTAGCAALNIQSVMLPGPNLFKPTATQSNRA
jgi:hypothetical protein